MITRPNKGDGVSVTLVRVLKAPVSAVYAAWCEPETVAEWLSPGGDQVTSVTIDLREGGRYRIEGLHPEGDAYSICGTYVELVPDRRIAFSWSYDGPRSPLRSDNSLVTVGFASEDATRTKITVSHKRIHRPDTAEITRIGWASCLEKLEAHTTRPASGQADRPAPSNPDFFSRSQRGVQDRLATRLVADRLEALLVKDRVDAADAAFIAGQNMLFMATVDSSGRPNCSYKGGSRGFVSVVHDNELAFPLYDGNGMQLTAGNIADTGQVELLFIDFDRQARIRVNGRARSSDTDPLLGSYPGARLIVRVQVDAVFSNCPRYVHRMKLVDESPFVPGASGDQPVPGWKRLHAVADVLPEGDRQNASLGTDVKKVLNRDR
jgi:uncharacterized protein YndB with AHSA1/START domain/predicted pyridoxine 5'-phosphate oxidase superfamily flavin-nucleotide-binding protein